MRPGTRRITWAAAALAATLAAALVAGCGVVQRIHHPGAPPAAEEPPPSAPESPPPPLPVEKAPEDVIVAAWAEPARLPAAGGQTQVLVRLQKRGGAPFPGVQVRLRTSTGSLYSGGKVLVTDEAGRTRDRLTTRRTAHITLNAGGTVYRFRVPVGEPSPSPSP
jgi:hypothetical protein